MAGRLGKKAGAVHDPRSLTVTDFVKLPSPPSRSTTGTGATIRLFANDRCGDCTAASMGHGIAVHENSARQRESALSDSDVLAVYAAVSGFDISTGNNDNGAYLIDVLRYMRTRGMGRQKDGSAHTITAYAKVDHSDLEEVKAAAWLFGGLYVGAGLPTSAEEEFDHARPWFDTEDAYGSWGGHAMWLPGYTSKYVTLTTWGNRQKATWDWFETYVDECWAVVSADFLERTNKTPRGVDVNKLNDYLGAL
jgi:hypothetical protein